MVTAQVAFAQAAPRIMYVKQVASANKKSYSYTAYVANADGSNANVVYTSTTAIGDVELSPSHDRAFIINANALKVLNLSVSGSSVTVSSTQVLDPGTSADGGVQFGDWSADGSAILYMTAKYASVHFKIISSSGGSPSWTYLASAYAGFPKYVGADKIAYVDYDTVSHRPSVRVIQFDLLGNVASDSQVFAGNVETIEAAHTSSSVIITGGNQINKLDLSSNTLTNLVSESYSVFDGVMNSDDSALYYRETTNSRTYTTQAVRLDLTSQAESVVSPNGDIRDLDAK